MPISEIGKTKDCSQTGYTLIEILAVIIMLSIIGLLVFPRFDGGEEKAYLKQIGRLIQADIQSVSEEAVCEKSEIVVEFFTNSYRFDIGDIEIRRVFDKFQFHWNFSLNELEKSEEFEEMETLGLSEEDVEMPEFGSLELCFTGDGVFPETVLEWMTQNYTGSMVFKSDGSMTWKYAPKRTI